MHGIPTILIDTFRLSLWLAILTAIFVPLERIFAVHPARIWRKGMGADLGYYFFSGQVAAMILSLPMGYVALAAHRFVPSVVQTTVSEAPLWFRLLGGLVVGEIGYYWGHRLMHVVPLLWRFHAIHHSPEHVDFLVDSRTHPFDLVFGRLCAIVPVYALGLAQPTSNPGDVAPILISLVGMVWPYFVHANVKWRLGPLEWIVTTPRFHHWHHAMEPANKNFAALLPAVDWLFGSFHLPATQWPPRYGIRDVVPDAWVSQLVVPMLRPFPVEGASQETRNAERGTDLSSQPAAPGAGN